MFVDIFSRRLKSVPACHARKFIKTVITKSQVALVVEVLPKVTERFQDESSAFVLCVRACIDVELYEKTRRVVFLPLEKDDNRMLADGENENRICHTCLEPESKFLDDLLSNILPLLNLFCCHVNELLEQNGARENNLKMGFCFNAATTTNSYFRFNSYNCLPRVLNVENVERNVKLDVVASKTSSYLKNVNSTNDSYKRALMGNFLPYMETCNFRQSMKRQYQESHLKLAIVNSYTKKAKLVCNLKPELNKILFNKVQNFLKELLAMGGIRMLRHKETKFLTLKTSSKESKLRALLRTAKPADDDDKYHLKSSSTQKISQDFSDCSHRGNLAAKLLKFLLSVAESTDDLKRKITRKSKIIEDYASSDPVKVYYLVNEIKEMAAASNKQCDLCQQWTRQNKYFEQRRFGILRNCDHIFCYPCIRNYADPRRERVPFRDPVQCPVCGVVSLTLAASSRWIEDPEEKAEFFKRFDQNVETICLYPMRYRTLSGRIRLQESSASRFPNLP